MQKLMSPGCYFKWRCVVETLLNAVADTPEQRLFRQGADVFAYFTHSAYGRGNPQFRSTSEGVDFRFASAQSNALCDQSPARYLQQYGDYCANRVMFGIPWGGDASSWRMTDGKLLVFEGQGSKDAFLLDEQRNLALADNYWAEEIRGSNSFLQRTKRLILRVPHHQRGGEQVRSVAAAR